MRINAPGRVCCLMHTTRYIANDQIVFMAVGYPETTSKTLGYGKIANANSPHGPAMLLLIKQTTCGL